MTYLRTSTSTFFVRLAALPLLVGAGFACTASEDDGDSAVDTTAGSTTDDPDLTTGATTPEPTTGEPEPTTGEDDPTTGEPEPTWEDIDGVHGWIQTLDAQSGAFVELDDAVVPATCDGALAAASGSPGLALAEEGTGGASDEGGGGGGGEPPVDPGVSELYDDGQLANRPDLPAVTPIYAVTVSGQIADTPDETYPRRIALEPWTGGVDELVYLDVCETAFARGGCFVPSEGFAFDGCVGVPQEIPGFAILSPELTREGDDWVLSYDATTSCSTDQAAATHPGDVPFGRQVLRMTLGDVADGESVAIAPELLTWESSYKSMVECEEIEDKGSVCTCTWDYRTTVELERASLVRDGNDVYLDLKGTGDDADYLMWLRLPLPAA